MGEVAVPVMDRDVDYDGAGEEVRIVIAVSRIGAVGLGRQLAVVFPPEPRITVTLRRYPFHRCQHHTEVAHTELVCRPACVLKDRIVRAVWRTLPALNGFISARVVPGKVVDGTDEVIGAGEDRHIGLERRESSCLFRRHSPPRCAVICNLHGNRAQPVAERFRFFARDAEGEHMVHDHTRLPVRHAAVKDMFRRVDGIDVLSEVTNFCRYIRYFHRVVFKLCCGEFRFPSIQKQRVAFAHVPGGGVVPHCRRQLFGVHPQAFGNRTYGQQKVLPLAVVNLELPTDLRRHQLEFLHNTVVHDRLTGVGKIVGHELVEIRTVIDEPFECGIDEVEPLACFCDRRAVHIGIGVFPVVCELLPRKHRIVRELRHLPCGAHKLRGVRAVHVVARSCKARGPPRPGRNEIAQPCEDTGTLCRIALHSIPQVDDLVIHIADGASVLEDTAVAMRPLPRLVDGKIIRASVHRVTHHMLL